MKSIKRILLVLSALALASVSFYFIDKISGEGKGPISATMDKIEKVLIGQPTKRPTVTEGTNEKRDSVKLKTIGRIPFNPGISALKSPPKLMIGYAGSSINELVDATIDMDKKLDTRMDLVQIYSAWGSKPNEQFPKDQVSKIVQMGSVPIITWEPWLSDFSDNIANQPPKEAREVNPLKTISSGVYDNYIRTWAKEAKQINSPLYLRFAHEMNDPYRYPWGPHNNEQGDFIAAWRHVHSIFKQMGADNVIWMWSIHSAYENYQAFYPGDAFVDVVSTGILNFGTSVYWSKWWTFEELFAPHYQALANFGKPIIIVEFGSLKVGGDRDKWYGDALTAIPKLYKKVKGIVFFNYPSDNTLTDKSVTWELGPNQTVTQKIKSILKDWELKQYTFQK